MGVFDFEKNRLRQKKIEVQALVALLNAGVDVVGPNAIEDCIEKLDRIAFPEDHAKEINEEKLEYQ